MRIRSLLPILILALVLLGVSPMPTHVFSSYGALGPGPDRPAWSIPRSQASDQEPPLPPEPETAQRSAAPRDADANGQIQAAPAPQADAGPDQGVAPGEPVILAGSGSSGQHGGITDWRWIQTGGPVVILTVAESDIAGFVAPAVEAPASLTFELRVTDAAGVVASDVCVVTVLPDSAHGQEPVADAGEDQAVAPGAVVTLDATGSFAPDGSQPSFSWKQLMGKPVTLSATDAATAAFTMPKQPGRSTLVFEVTVTGTGGVKATDYVSVRAGQKVRRDTARAELSRTDEG